MKARTALLLCCMASGMALAQAPPPSQTVAQPGKPAAASSAKPAPPGSATPAKPSSTAAPATAAPSPFGRGAAPAAKPAAPQAPAMAKKQAAKPASKPMTAKKAPAKPAVKKTPATEAAAAPAAAPAKPSGKRDPFISPIVETVAGNTGPPCTTGKKCLAINDMALKGIVKSQAGMIAVVESSSRHVSYFLRENDPVFNGYVVKITGDSVEFRENVMDRLGKTTTHDVVKKVNAPVV